MFRPTALCWKTSSPGSYDDLKTAFADPKRQIAYAIDRGAHSNNVYYASSESGYDPMYTLLAVGECTAATLNYALDTISAGAKGIKSFHTAVTKGYAFKAAGGTTKSFTIPEADAKKYKYFYVGLDDRRLMSELASRKVALGPTAIVADIQSVAPSVKTKEGKYESVGMQTVHRLYLAAAFTLLRKLPRSGGRDGVVAIIVDKEGRIIAWGQKHDTLWHGETSAVMALGGKLPAGCAVYSTLKPCHMCAGLLYERSGGNIRVYWGQDDATPAATRTALDVHKVGAMLSGNKNNTNVARAILQGPKPTGGVDMRDGLGKTLAAGLGKSKQASAIDYIVTPEAAKITVAAEKLLSAKFKTYTATDDGNDNTRHVIRHIMAFLKTLKISPEA